MGPTSRFDTAMPACSTWAAARASTIVADMARPRLRWRCWSSAINPASSRIGSTSISLGRFCELFTKSGLGVSRQTDDRLGELAGRPRAGERGAQAEEPQPGGRHPLRRDAAQVGLPLAGQDVAQQMVVDDEGRHLRGGQVGIVETAHEPAMFLSRKSLRQELLSPAGREQDEGITQVDHRHPAAVIQPPPMAHGSRHRHLPTGGDEKSSRRHGYSLDTGIPGSTKYPYFKLRRRFQPAGGGPRISANCVLTSTMVPCRTRFRASPTSLSRSARA